MPSSIGIFWGPELTHPVPSMKLYIQHLGENFTDITTGDPSSRLEKKPTIDSWKRHALCDSVFSYEKNRWKFEEVIRNSIGNVIWLIYNNKHFEIWTLKFNNLLTSCVSVVVSGDFCRFKLAFPSLLLLSLSSSFHRTRDAFVNFLIADFFSRRELGPPVISLNKLQSNTQVSL